MVAWGWALVTANWCGVSFGDHENVLWSDGIPIRCDNSLHNHIAGGGNIYDDNRHWTAFQ